MSDLWDMLDDCKNNDIINNVKIIQEQYDHEQALISVKKEHSVFHVERSYINSKEYYDKFEKLPLSKDVQIKLYKETGRLLEFIDGLDEEKIEQERMTVLNFRTGEHIVDNFERDGEIYKTGFTLEELSKVHNCPDSIIVIHNHSHNGRPSGKDLLTYIDEEKIKLSIIACHNGDLYAIYWVKETFRTMYNDLTAIKMKYAEEAEAKRLALTELYQLNDALPDKHKAFKVVKL